VASTQEIVESHEQSQFSFDERDVGRTRLERYDGAYWRRLTAIDEEGARNRTLHASR